MSTMEEISKLLADSLREIISNMSKEELLTDFFKPEYAKKWKLHLLTREQILDCVLKKE